MRALLARRALVAMAARMLSGGLSSGDGLTAARARRSD
jgi:hypothetical protein